MLTRCAPRVSAAASGARNRIFQVWLKERGSQVATHGARFIMRDGPYVFSTKAATTFFTPALAARAVARVRALAFC